MHYDIIGESPTIDNYENRINGIGCTQIISKPTRICSSCSSVIDHAYINSTSLSQVSSFIFQENISDHLLVCTKYQCNFNRNTKRSHYRKITQEGFEFFLAHLNNKLSTPDWLYPGNYTLDKLLNLLNELISQHFHKKMQSRRQYKVSKHPWITPDILTAIKYKHKLYSKCLKSKSPDLYYEYKKCRNKVTHVKAKAKQKHFENLFKDARDTADTWKYINQLLKKTKSKTTFPHTIKTDGKLITSLQNICNEINKHFVKIGEQLAANSNNSSFHQSNQHFTFLGKRNVSSIVLQPTDVYEIIEIISSLKDHKSPGYIDIPMRIIKESKFLISDYLASSFNESLETGSYPEVLQIATVIPVHKGRSTLELGNYRPILILSPIKNVFETILHKRLTKF